MDDKTDYSHMAGINFVEIRIPKKFSVCSSEQTETENFFGILILTRLGRNKRKIFHKNAACIAMQRFKTVNLGSVHTLYQYLTD
jgi:hypothetical protein